jgi:hypothetical protein
MSAPVFTEFGNRRTVNVNQNQGGSVYPFDGVCEFAGLVSDIDAVFDCQVSGDVYVRIWRNVLRLQFTDADNNILLDTNNSAFTRYDLGNGCWFWSDKRGRNTCRYSESTSNPDPTYQYSASMSAPAKLVSRCWSVPVTNIYYVEQQTHSNNLELRFEDGLLAVVENNIITVSEDTISDQTNAGPFLRTINRIPADSNGNFYLAGDEQCIEVTALNNEGFDDSDPYLTTSKPPSTVIVRNDCTECCKCEDYVFWLNIINNLIEIHNYEVSYLQYLTEYHEKLLDFYNRSVEIRLADIVKLRCVPDQNYSTFNFSVNNPSSTSLFDLTATLQVTGEGTGQKIKRVFIYDASYDCGDPTSLVFTIPELKAHSTWSGAVSIMWDECGTTATASFSVDGLPWSQNSVACASKMTCVPVAGPDVMIPVPLKLPTEIELPKPPLINTVPDALYQPDKVFRN